MKQKSYNEISRCIRCELKYPVYKLRCDVCHKMLRHRPRNSLTKAKYITGSRY